jgi:hypothetical protein
MRVLAPLLSLFAAASAAFLRDEMAESIQRLQGGNGQTWAVLVAGSNTYSNYRWVECPGREGFLSVF